MFLRSRRLICYISIILYIVLSNILLLHYISRCQTDSSLEKTMPQKDKLDRAELVRESNPFLMAVFMEFEEFHNDLADTVANISKSIQPDLTAVLSEQPIYPPILFSDIYNIKTVIINSPPGVPVRRTRPENLINSKYVILVPDFVRLVDPYYLQHMIEVLESGRRLDNRVSMASFPLSPNITCYSISFDVRRWTVTYTAKHTSNAATTQLCDAVINNNNLNDVIVLIDSSKLLNFTYPFLRPSPLTLYLQNSLQGGLGVVDMGGVRGWRRVGNHGDDRVRLKQERKEKERLKGAFKTLGVKLVKWLPHNRDNVPAPLSLRVEWFGCTRQTPRCFGTVVKDVPDFLTMSRWTPPCCLEGLRHAVRHVVGVLSQWGVRYWLEGGSLLGAARGGDLIEWDYDVDIGIYKSDLIKCPQLVSAMQSDKEEGFVDGEGYVWERAREGGFYRVQYSNINHLHVDIFPFQPQDGIMVRGPWHTGHPQDRDFPESLLLPLTNISFTGLNVSAPHRVREFLELKFGPGVIENPKYPDLKPVS